LREILEQFSLWAALDILIIAVIVYQCILLLRGTRAAQMLTGILLLVALGGASSVLPFTTLHWLISKLYPSFILILIIIFQDDIRHMLSTMGRRPILATSDSNTSRLIIDEISKACISLASKRIGALIVFERDLLLSRYVEIGTTIEGRVSKELLLSIFHPSSPIHDGAVIVRKGRIAAAGCFLPLTKDENIDPNLGTRHRAAIGISQESDAVVVIVSEETATASIVVEGKLRRKVDFKTLRDGLIELLAPEELLKDGETSDLPEKDATAKVKDWLMTKWLQSGTSSKKHDE
jgi:diadenylate cyclase